MDLANIEQPYFSYSYVDNKEQISTEYRHLYKEILYVHISTHKGKKAAWIVNTATIWGL